MYGVTAVEQLVGVDRRLDLTKLQPFQTKSSVKPNLFQPLQARFCVTLTWSQELGRRDRATALFRSGEAPRDNERILRCLLSQRLGLSSCLT